MLRVTKKQAATWRELVDRVERLDREWQAAKESRSVAVTQSEADEWGGTADCALYDRDEAVCDLVSFLRTAELDARIRSNKIQEALEEARRLAEERYEISDLWAHPDDGHSRRQAVYSDIDAIDCALAYELRRSVIAGLEAFEEEQKCNEVLDLAAGGSVCGFSPKTAERDIQIVEIPNQPAEVAAVDEVELESLRNVVHAIEHVERCRRNHWDFAACNHGPCEQRGLR